MFGSDRPIGSVLYFMVTAESQVRLHRIRSDQMYHYYLGDPLEVLLLQRIFDPAALSEQDSARQITDIVLGGIRK